MSNIDRLPDLIKKILAGYDYNPGSSDLDDEQPISVSMTLGDYRQLMRLSYGLRPPTRNVTAEDLGLEEK
jgi:hypothetical protein